MLPGAIYNKISYHPFPTKYPTAAPIKKKTSMSSIAMVMTKFIRLPSLFSIRVSWWLNIVYPFMLSPLGGCVLAGPEVGIRERRKSDSSFKGFLRYLILQILQIILLLLNHKQWQHLVHFQNNHNDTTYHYT